jgi:LacI family transcriptional regulator
MANSSRSKRPRLATLADVGRAAGVSSMAASAVLNGARTSSRIADGTRKRILKAAAQLRYRPNAAARALVKRRMNTIGVVAAIGGGDLNVYAVEILMGILSAAAHAGQNTTVFTLPDWGHGTEQLRTWCDERTDGLILIAPTFTRSAAKSLPTHQPFVALHANVALPNIVNIETDEERGAFEAVRYLISLGHRRIMHISGDRGLVGPERRIKGYRGALAAEGIHFDPSLFVECHFGHQSGQTAMRAWMKRHAGKPMPEAVFCANDAIAAGCLEVFAEVGLRVPDDVSVVGFDDTLAARTTVPQLTTVRQPLRAMGSRAVEVLLKSIHADEGGTAAGSGESIVFPVELVIRESAAAPPPATRLVPAPRFAG